MALERTGSITLPAASGGIEAYRLVRIDSSNDFAYCAAGERPYGRSNNGVAATYQASADLWETGRTFKVTAAAAILQFGKVYTAASGKVSSTQSGSCIGIALEASTADGDVIEVLALPDNVIAVTMPWNAPPARQSYFEADRAYRIIGARAFVDVAGTDAGAVTAIMAHAASGTSLAGGTAVHTSTINLKGTANTTLALTLEATANLNLAAGSHLGLSFTGTTTAAVGCAVAFLVPA